MGEQNRSGEHFLWTRLPRVPRSWLAGKAPGWRRSPEITSWCAKYDPLLWVEAFPSDLQTWGDAAPSGFRGQAGFTPIILKGWGRCLAPWVQGLYWDAGRAGVPLRCIGRLCPGAPEHVGKPPGRQRRESSEQVTPPLSCGLVS